MSLTENFGNLHTPYTALVTLIDLVMYTILAINVGRAHARFKVELPATEGPPEFRRIYRTHMNTLEHMVVNLPLMWLAALSVSDVFAALAGCLWLVGRVLFARGYYRETSKRLLGFRISLLSNMILLIGVLASVIASL